MNWIAKWVKPATAMGDISPVFTKTFTAKENMVSAKLFITALGTYEATLNGKRIGDFVLAPGWTAYQTRLQYQEYDVTDLMNADNALSITVGKGWYRSPMPGWQPSEIQDKFRCNPAGLLAQLEIIFADGSKEIISSDESWTAAESSIRFSEIYDGETFDASFTAGKSEAVTVFDGPSDTLIPQQGEAVREQERLAPSCIFTTPKGETVVDFGQEVTGYVEINVDAAKSDQIRLSHAEVMDQEGNFYTANYRSAKAKYTYICKDGKQSAKARLTFFGFRYIRIDQFPGGPAAVKPEHFTAIVIHSEMKRTGYLNSSNPQLNKLFDNIIWGQKGNFVDVPTDCPQRDERLGWTGDAQVFIRTACLNYDVEKFFTKWLADMSADQRPDGGIGHVIPDILGDPACSSAWGDAATICPWELYQAYGNPQILADQFDCMKKWVDYITATTKDINLWTGGTHFGDWLGLDAPSGSYKGASREDFIASAFYAYSTSLVIKTGHVLNADITEYETLYKNIAAAFRKAYPTYQTQTECVLAAHFELAEDLQATADQLAKLVKECGVKLQTGFVGTPYLMHVLSNYGYSELAYSLVLRDTYPSWLYPVTKGATTIWEHWDGIMEDGSFWSDDMNSYNHYAYGAVADWVYQVAAGIRTLEDKPGYEKVSIAPVPDARLDWLEASLDTRHGKISSVWKKDGEMWRYEIETPVATEITIDGTVHVVDAGKYLYYSKI